MIYKVVSTSNKTGMSFRITTDCGKSNFTLDEAKALIAELGDTKFLTNTIEETA